MRAAALVAATLMAASLIAGVAASCEGCKSQGKAYYCSTDADCYSWHWDCAVVCKGSCNKTDSCSGPGPGPAPGPPSPPSPAGSEFGGDVAFGPSTATFRCLRERNAWKFVVVRSYHGYGAVDTRAPQTLANAADAGIAARDIYHFPCRSQSPQQQLAAGVAAVGKSNFTTLWLDVETNPSTHCDWKSHSLADNCAWVQSFIGAAQDMGVHVGVYTSHGEWAQVVGAGCKSGADVPLWFARYDGRASMSGFEGIGGWSTFFSKQYADKIPGQCKVIADADIRDAAGLARSKARFDAKYGH
jgi:GH25 family lysozyme M1 (1,4-beta-N-acetylmuramidase)